MAIYNEEFSLPLVAQGAGATVIGKVTQKPQYILRHGGREVVNVPLDVLTGDVRRPRTAEPARTGAKEPDGPQAVDLFDLFGVLGHRDVCSRRPIIERYDSVVRGTTAIPAGYADAGVILPIPGAPLGVALSVDGNPRYGAIDAKQAAAMAVVESVCNVTAVGARPLGLTDCLNFGNPERPDHFGELVAAIDGLAEAAEALDLAYVSGNVSLYNQASNGKPVPASAIVGCIGAIDDIAHSATTAFTAVGSKIFLVGERQSALGGSIIQDVANLLGLALPKLDYQALRAELTLVRESIGNDTILAAHDISDGGLLAALAEMCFVFSAPGSIGARIRSGEWSAKAGQAGAFFGEANGFLVEVDPAKSAAFAERAKALGAKVWEIGETIAEPNLKVDDTMSVEIEELFAAWDEPLAEIYP